MPGVEASHRFPFVSLEKAVERAQRLYDASPKGGDIMVSAAFELWGYSGKSSGGFQTISALKMYGITADNGGAGESRKMRLTKEGLEYFREEREDRRALLLQGFARMPSLFASLWNEWGDSPPADVVARSQLKVERGLNDQSARAVLNIYKDNLAFASLKGHDKVPEPSDADEENESAPMETPVTAKTAPGMDAVFAQVFANHSKKPAAQAAPEVEENNIRVLLSGDRLQITADVDAKGIKKLKRILDMHLAVMADEDDD